MKFFKVFVVALLALFIGCSDGPETVAVNAAYAISHGDTAEFMKYIDADESEKSQIKGKLDIMVAGSVAQVNSMGGLKDVKVIETKSKGKYKIVTLEKTYGNGKTQTQELRLKEKNGKWVIVL